MNVAVRVKMLKCLQLLCMLSGKPPPECLTFKKKVDRCCHEQVLFIIHKREGDISDCTGKVSAAYRMTGAPSLRRPDKLKLVSGSDCMSYRRTWKAPASQCHAHGGWLQVAWLDQSIRWALVRCAKPNTALSGSTASERRAQLLTFRLEEFIFEVGNSCLFLTTRYCANLVCRVAEE